MLEHSPVTVSLSELLPQLKAKGYAVLDPTTVAQWAHHPLAELAALIPDWEGMPEDAYLKDGGHYRLRRHSCFVFENDQLALAPVRAHWQSLSYNALHGGMQRWFEPMHPHTIQQTVWIDLLSAFARTADALHHSTQPASTVARRCIEAHQFRIDTKDGIGRPTPEGAHRDGVDLVGVFMINRQHVKGGETRVFDAKGTSGQRFTLSESWSLLLLDDARVIHETTPIQPAQPGGYRDTLVLTCRAGSFQGE
ncbi:MAG: 2OG-Fe dioxygenase family protein [Alcaligenaceae bacterium]